MTLRFGEAIRSVIQALATGPGDGLIEPMDAVWAAAEPEDRRPPTCRPDGAIRVAGLAPA